MTRHTSGDMGRRDLLVLAATALAASLLPRAALAQAAPVKVGMIGSGREGGALGTLFAKAGHKVMFSSRNPDNLKDLVAAAGPNASAGPVEQAVAFADVVVLAVPYPAIKQIGADHAAALATKMLVLDVSNPIQGRDGEEIVKWVAEQGGPGLATAKMLPGAKIVRGFNAIGSSRLTANAHRAGEPLGVPIAGDDGNAIALASALTKEIGFEAVLVGGLAMGKYLVPGTPLGGERTAAEIKQVAAGLR